MALLTSYVALHKLLNLSETQFPSLQNGNNNVYFSRIDEKLKWNDRQKVPGREEAGGQKVATIVSSESSIS